MYRKSEQACCCRRCRNEVSNT